MDYPEFSRRTRAEKISELASTEKVFDAIVVGGGIVGVGLARELAIRGKSCLVAEKNDFASGTSSKSSKLIHGGLRYLEMFDFHLVFEALAERHWLLQTHPHLVQPLEFVLPTFQKDNGPPGARSTALLGVGLWLYDALSLFRSPFFHGRHSRAKMQALFPQIRREGLKGGLFYADAMMLDDELVLETALDAHRRGAALLNYVKVAQVSERGADGLFTVTLEETVASSGQPKRFTAKSREVVACVGPWTEKFGERVVSGSGRKLKPSKGVHLVLPYDRLPVERCLVMYHPDGRILFAIPRKDLGKGAELVIVGTTDSSERGDLDNVHSNEADIKYLLTVLGHYFPQAAITEKDILTTFAGVRPLLDDGSETEAKTSREHEIWRNRAGVVFMAGGKYTTFRKISEELAEFTFPKTKVRGKLSKERLSDPNDYKARLEGKPIWGKFSDEWIRWKIRHHAAVTLEDIVFRRIPLWMLGKELSPELLDQVAAIAKEELQLSDAEVSAQRAEVLVKVRSGAEWA